jgi:hypothetical protein
MFIHAKKLSLIAILALLGSALVASPAQGMSACTSGDITIQNNIVTGNVECVGSVTIPASVTSIADSAFENATSITAVTFQAGSELETIGVYAFDNATSLTSITIPATVTSIGGYAFYGATSLTTVNFQAGSNLKTVGRAAFYRATSLTSITIPATVTSIGGYAFYGATSLASITIPASVTSIGGFAFLSATSLTTVTFEAGSKLETIGSYAFYGATSLASIIIPASVTSIVNRAFYNATSLTTVNFEDGSKLETIGSSAFFMSSLTSITIPETVTTITSTSFAGSSLLTSVTFEGDEPTVVREPEFVSDSLGTRPNSPNFNSLTFKGNARTLALIEPQYGFAFRGVPNGIAYINADAEGFGETGDTWEGLTIVRADPAPAAAAAPTPYSGALPSEYSDRTPKIGDEVTISGADLDQVTSCTIDGVEVEISSQSATGLTIVIPEGLKPGLKDLVMVGAFGKLTAQGALTVEASPAKSPVVAEKTNAGSFNGYVAVYAKGHKGKTLSWKIAGKWFKTTITSDFQVFQRKTEAVGLDVEVHLYIDGEKQSTMTVRTS